MDHSIKTFQKKIFIAVSLTALIAMIILVMMSTSRIQRSKTIGKINESHEKIEKKLDKLIAKQCE